MYYSEAPLTDAISLQRMARTLIALAERWTSAEPAAAPAPSPFAGTPDLNDERAIETSGVLFMEGAGEPAEIGRMKSELAAIAATSEQTGSWLASAIDASWAMAEALLAYPQLADMLAERHKIIAINWQNAFTAQLIARCLRRAVAIMERVDFSPAGLRKDLAATRSAARHRYSAAELVGWRLSRDGEHPGGCQLPGGVVLASLTGRSRSRRIVPRMSFVVLWLRYEGRRRWRALLALGVLLAVATAAVLTAVAGAQRGATAVGRLLAVTRPATAEVVPNHAGFDWRRVRALPEVAALTTFPAYTSLPIDQVPGDAPLTPFIPADRAGMRTIEAPVVLAGRLADPARADEAVVTPAFTGSTGLGVGDTVTAHLTTPAQADAGVATGRGGRPAGPVVRLRIVGVVRSLWYGDDAGGGSLIPSPGLLARYRDNFLGKAGMVPLNAIVRLRGGEAGLPRFRADVAQVGGLRDVQVLDRGEVARHYRSVTGFESSCLFALGLAGFLAGLVLAGQAITRHVSASGSDLRALGAVGLTRPQAAAAAAAGPVLAAAAGAGAGAGLAFAASGWLPFGAAAAKEPHPDMSADWLVLGGGWALTVALVAAAAAAAGWLAVARRGSAPPVRGSAVVQAAARSGLPVPAVIGARFALEPGRGRSAVPVRPALTGAVTGVLGVIAAFTFAAGVTDAAAHPARFGQTYQLEVALGSDGHDFRPAGPVLRALAADSDIAGLTDLRVGAGSSGAASVTAYSYHPVGAPAPLVLASGHPPQTSRDLVLAPQTARRLAARVGSLVPLTGDRGTRRMRVTGIGFGVESSTTPYDTGGWVTPGAYDALFSGFKEHGALLALRAGADPGTVIPRLQRLGPGGGQLLIFPPFAPRQRSEISDIRVLPVALGGFLGLLAIAAVGHALTTMVRRRGHDLALLRALGLTRAQARWVATAQASVFGFAGLLAGIPLGLAAGRALWQAAAGLIPLYYQPPTAPWALLLIGPAVLACVLALALIPGGRAARLPIAPLLREE